MSTQSEAKIVWKIEKFLSNIWADKVIVVIMITMHDNDNDDDDDN